MPLEPAQFANFCAVIGSRRRRRRQCVCVPNTPTQIVAIRASIVAESERRRWRYAENVM